MIASGERWRYSRKIIRMLVHCGSHLDDGLYCVYIRPADRLAEVYVSQLQVEGPTRNEIVRCLVYENSTESNKRKQ